ncbi:hypothetical protein OL548_23515 [Lysinibacillus sp. MHQ-1]|nr:hypothetical protein OL548_23515 [Lysinibacillus sp. MHQ-1]
MPRKRYTMRCKWPTVVLTVVPIRSWKRVLKNTLAPNGVCAFEVTDKQAGEHFQKWIKGRWFTPKAAKK